jgi:hypothetical protein
MPTSHSLGGHIRQRLHPCAPSSSPCLWRYSVVHSHDPARLPIQPVRFWYALRSPLQAGPFYVRKRPIEFWSICSPSPTEALTKEDHTAPIQTAPLKLHSEGGTLNGLKYAKRRQVHSGVAKYPFVGHRRKRQGFPPLRLPSDAFWDEAVTELNGLNGGSRQKQTLSESAATQ